MLSDSHKNISAILKAIAANEQVDYIVHLGDHASDIKDVPLAQKVFYVKGNCDIGDIPTHNIIMVEGYRILLTHGHLQHVKSSLLQLNFLTAEQQADIVLYGHTHVPDISYGSNGRIMLNPGSIGAPRRGTSTYCVLNVDKDKGIHYEIKSL